MSQDIHTWELINGSGNARSDRILASLQMAVANLVGGGAGATVTVAVTFPEVMPAAYAVFVDTGQDTVTFVTARTTTGFTLNINPRLAANTVAVGTVNILVIA